MIEKDGRSQNEKAIIQELGFDPWDHPTKLPRRPELPAYEPYPPIQAVASRGLLWLTGACAVGIVVMVVAIAWLIMGR